MSDYNPNSIWSSKEKKYEYQPDPRVVLPSSDRKFSSPGVGGANNGGSGGGAKKIIITAIVALVVVIFLGFLYYVLKPAPPQNLTLSFSNPGQVLLASLSR